MHELLQIVEVDPECKVRCCAPNCHRPVYKRIHVIRENGAIIVLGEICYKLLYEGAESKKSNYFTGHSRKLSAEERKLLIENTDALIKQFELESQVVIKKPAVPIYSSSPISPYPQSLRYERKALLPEIEPQGDSRRVTCFYCGTCMFTHLASTPAKGFKCAQCKVNNVSLPKPKSGTYRK